MIRRGIYNSDQLRSGSLQDIFGKDKNISIYLYRNIDNTEDPEIRNLFAELILNRFNSDRNVIKRTYKNRFNNFDRLSIDKITELKFSDLSILDVAISDGRASCFFLELAINKFPNLDYVGTDIQVCYFLNKKHSASRSYIITDERNRIVEITKPPFVWNLARTEGKYYFINNFLKKYFLKQAFLDLARNRYEYKEKFDLIHPDFRSIIKGNNCFRVLNYNLFDEIPGSYNVIRAMNILHFGYFNKSQMNLIMDHIYTGLSEGGIFIEGSNEGVGSQVDGAIYMKKNNRFVLLNEPENPSRIREFVLDFNPKSSNER
jgi:hypothetical protein